jgi:hypothetical protein
VPTGVPRTLVARARTNSANTAASSIGSTEAVSRHWITTTSPGVTDSPRPSDSVIHGLSCGTTARAPTAQTSASAIRSVLGFQVARPEPDRTLMRTSRSVSATLSL